MTMKLLQTYKTFDIVTVPFPFVTDARSKIRPALVISSQTFFNNFVDHSILAMITSSEHASWPHDALIHDFKECGLTKPCLIRFKLFTIDNRLIRNRIGILSKPDQKRIRSNFAVVFKEIVTK